MDLNKVRPKHKYPTMFIDHIIDGCDDNAIFSFMDDFSGYNRIHIQPICQQKITFIYPCGKVFYQKVLFGSNISRGKFKWAM